MPPTRPNHSAVLTLAVVGGLILAGGVVAEVFVATAPCPLSLPHIDNGAPATPVALFVLNLSPVTRNTQGYVVDLGIYYVVGDAIAGDFQFHPIPANRTPLPAFLVLLLQKDGTESATFNSSLSSWPGSGVDATLARDGGWTDGYGSSVSAGETFQLESPASPVNATLAVAMTTACGGGGEEQALLS